MWYVRLGSEYFWDSLLHHYSSAGRSNIHIDMYSLVCIIPMELCRYLLALVYGTDALVSLMYISLMSCCPPCYILPQI
jgi:hypothetical protein